MSWADDGPDDGNHEVLEFHPEGHRADPTYLEYALLRALWKAFKAEYDLAPEDAKQRLRENEDTQL